MARAVLLSVSFFLVYEIIVNLVLVTGTYQENTWSGGVMAGKHHFKSWEDEILKKKWRTHTDKEIGAEIGRSEEAIANRRKKLGLFKGAGRPSADQVKAEIKANPTDYSLASLSKDDRIEFYKTQFNKNHRYPFLCKILLDDEIPYYRHKYIEFMDSVDSITLQEEELLHNMLMTEIHILRIQEEMRNAISAYQNESDAPPPPQYLRKDLDEAEKRYKDYHRVLNVTREQRLKTDKEEKITITGIVRNLLEAENKRRSGEKAGIMSYFKNKCQDEMTKMDFLLGVDDNV